MPHEFPVAPAAPHARSLVAVPPLDHGVTGNGAILALVSPTSAVEWLCMPRFDSPSVFARIVDHDRGGTFRILAHDGSELRGALAYLPNTNVLVNRFEQGDDAWEVVDFAPRLPVGWGARAPVRFTRVVRPLRGRPRLRVDFDPRLDYARAVTEKFSSGHGVLVTGTGGPVVLETNAPIAHVLSGQPCTLAEPWFFELSYGPAGTGHALSEVLHELELTTEGWRTWARTCTLPVFAPEAVLRSALCLKLHACIDTGAIIAATTTSIPEAMGTERTWDYRHCWIRDSAFVVEALRRLSHLGEGACFLRFLSDVAEAGPLQPVYGVDGRRDLPEETLSHLAGFGGNGPVRIGNAAALQSQHDVMGELMLCMQTLLLDPRIVRTPSEERSMLPLLERLVNEAARLASVPDTSIWEFRTLPRNYTFSRAMCWVAIDRGARLARWLGERTLADEWQRRAESERAIVLARGYNEKLGFFTQALDGEFPDASNLLLPTLGLLDARDPRFLATLDAYRARLVDRGLMLRYKNLDDFGETTSAFTICSFWWAEALALAGRLEEAIDVFERVSAHANPLGLFSEDVEPETGALLGNFPQAYTHVGLVHAAVTIGALLEARDGRVRAWA